MAAVLSMDLSVVIASIDASRSIEDCLRHLERACATIHSELLVVDASTDNTAARVEALGGRARLVRLRPGTLTPCLWAEGYRRSTGRIVAFTTGHCLVTPGWATSLMEAIDAGATGAGGPLALAKATGPIDWAVFYLRYSAFMPGMMAAGRISGDLAGDNAAYRRHDLDRHASTFEHGFWELDFHRRVRAEGGWLAAVPTAIVVFGRSFRLRTILRHRLAHGRQFGAARAATRAPWQLVLAGPLVPLVLAARAASRLLRRPADRWRFVIATPWFLMLAAAWAAGEAWGAMCGMPPELPPTRERPRDFDVSRCPGDAEKWAGH